jgi:carbon storage regulator
MLVLSRKVNETIVINGDIRVTVVSIRGNQVRLGFDAPDSVGIFREELYDRAGADQECAAHETSAAAIGHSVNHLTPLGLHVRTPRDS